MKKIRKEDAAHYKLDKIESFLLISPITTNSQQIYTILVEMDIGGFQHKHSHSSEQMYYILQGSGKMVVGDEEKEVKAGDCIYSL